MIAGSDIEKGCANSLTKMPSCLPSRVSSARRVGSASAAKVRSRASSLYLTIWFSIGAAKETVKWFPPPGPPEDETGMMDENLSASGSGE